MTPHASRLAEKRAAARAKARAALAAMTDEEDAAITAAALADPDNPPLTDEQRGRLRPAAAPEIARRTPRSRGRRRLRTEK